jgi:hypothetical protein
MAKTESLKSANGVWKRKAMASGERHHQRHQRRHGGVSKALASKGCISVRSWSEENVEENRNQENLRGERAYKITLSHRRMTTARINASAAAL